MRRSFLCACAHDRFVILYQRLKTIPVTIMARRMNILLIEDNDNDVFFFERALAKSEFNGRCFRVRNGAEGIEYLEGTGKYADRFSYPLPDEIICDLNMPGTGGFEFVLWFRHQRFFSDITLTILSGSEDVHDFSMAVKMGVPRYFAKPEDTEKWDERVRELLRI